MLIARAVVPEISPELVMVLLAPSKFTPYEVASIVPVAELINCGLVPVA